MLSIFRFFNGLKNGNFYSFRAPPRRRFGRAVISFFFDIILYHPKEHSLWFSALNLKILMATSKRVVGCRGSLRDPRGSPDFLRIFPNFHIFYTWAGKLKIHRMRSADLIRFLAMSVEISREDRKIHARAEKFYTYHIMYTYRVSKNTPVSQ